VIILAEIIRFIFILNVHWQGEKINKKLI